MSRPANMPPLEDVGPALSPFEFWPQGIFYAPMVAWWLLLAIRYGDPRYPFIANPGFPLGGFVGESKAAVLARFGPRARAATAPFVLLPAAPLSDRRDALARALAESRLRLPIVIKPDVGCRGAGVRRITTQDRIASVLALYPEEVPLLAQNWVSAPGEAGLFYARHPDERHGRLLSMTLKYFPRVTGDGRRSLRALIQTDRRARRLLHLYAPRLGERLDEVVPAGEEVVLTHIGAHAKGAIFRDGRPYLTEALGRRIDAIARDIDGFFVGRFDVRFHDFAALRRGEDLVVIEVNGAGGEATHIWDSRYTLARAWRDLARQYRLLFEIGRAQHRRGVPLPPAGEILRAWRREARLVSRYPWPD
ncbi:MAG: D-alanine--D-alanine ligase [Alphaproteobacteria bacterium]|nr:MAG: D-alanine--D-alanine ligase [Alphaproteobacteria bacterium]